MAILKTKAIDLEAADADGLAEAQAVAGAGALTLNGALISGGTFTSADFARQIGILSAGNDAGITFTIVGTGPDGKDLTEVVTGSAAAPGTAESTGYFLTVASITASGAAAGNVSAGTVDEAVTNTIPLDRHNSDPATISVEDVTGTINYSIDETMSDLQNAEDFEFYNVTAFDNKVAAFRGDISNHATGVRLRVNSYSTGADVKMVIIQNRPR